MIEQVLPAAVAAVETRTDPAGVRLWVEEEPLTTSWVESRRQEFATGRACARAALAVLGHDPVAILIGAHREPLWPDGVVGSITHCPGYRAAAVARASSVRSLGIDAEPHAPVPAGVSTLVTAPEERRQIARLRETHPDVHWDRLLFSAKESIYKAWFPLAGRWLGFEDALVALDPDAGTFTGTLLVPGPCLDGVPVTRLKGRWLVTDQLVLTAAVVAAVQVDVRG